MLRSPGVLSSPATIPSPSPAIYLAQDRFFTPLFSSPSESLFSQLLSFHIYLRCPLVFSPGLPVRLARLRPARPCFIFFFSSFVLSGLAPLIFSCLSFAPIHPLLSADCTLFSKNRRVGIPVNHLPAVRLAVHSSSRCLAPPRIAPLSWINA